MGFKSTKKKGGNLTTGPPNLEKTFLQPFRRPDPKLVRGCRPRLQPCRVANRRGSKCKGEVGEGTRLHKARSAAEGGEGALASSLRARGGNTP